MTKSRHINQPRIKWTPEQDRALRERYPHERTEDIARDINIPIAKVYAKASWLGLKKSQEFMASPSSGRTNGRQGIGSRFVKGQRAWNEGQHYQAGGRCAETQFRNGHKLNNEAPLGALRVNRANYLERKTLMTINPPARRWVGVHRLVWIEANGPVPDGHVVVFKPGCHSAALEEISLDKVELVTRAELMQRNSYHTNYPKEIAQLIQLRGAVNRKINRRLKHERANQSDK